jgi:tyrosine-protein kinase Etk/Wzc
MATPLSETRSHYELADAGSEPGSVSFAELIDNLLFFWPWFVRVCLSVMALGLAWTFLQTPIYEATALVQVEPQKGSSLGALKDISALLDASAGGALQSLVPGEIEILKSRTVRLEAMRRSGADMEVTVSGRIPLVGGFLARTLPAGEDGLVKPFLPFNLAYGGEVLKISDFTVADKDFDERFILEVIDPSHYRLTSPDDAVLGVGEVGKTAVWGPVSLTVTELRGRPGNRFKIRKFEPRARIKKLADEITIAEASRNSNVIKITFADRDPEHARDFMNALVDAYVEHNVSHRSEEAAKSLAFLRARLPEMRRQLTDAESRLNAFRNTEQILDVNEQTKALLDRAVSLETGRQTLELQRAELSLKYEPAHPALKAVDAQLRSLQKNISKAEIEIRRLPEKEQRYLTLERDVQVDNELYVSLLNNAEQLEVARAGTVGNVSVIDRADVPEKPAKPKKPLMIAIFGLLGIALGFAATQLMAFLTGIVREPKKLEQATNLSVIALIPHSEEQAAQRYHDTRQSYLLTTEEPNSPVVEALRSLRTATLFSLSALPRGKVLLVTSATPSQGKSFVAANLAALFASGSGRRVLIIDADIRKRSLKEYLPLPAGGMGFTDLLTGRLASPVDALVDLGDGLTVLPPGTAEKDPGRLLSGEGFAKVIDWAVDHFDLIVVDSAPVLAVSDTLELAKHVDETLFVVRQNEVGVTEVTEALVALKRVGVVVAGVVFNSHQPTGLRYGYAYGYGYGRYRYNYRYGKQKYGYRYGSENPEKPT